MEEASATKVRLAELLAALSLGIDLGFGQPMEHVLRQCRIALRLVEIAGLDDAERAAVYYSALLVNVGCHTDAYEQARWFGDDIAMKATKYAHEPGTARDLLTMLRLLGSGGTPLHRLRVALDLATSARRELDQMIVGHANAAAALGRSLGLSDDVLAALGSSYERWDGKGFPGDLSGTGIPMASRIVHLAEFVEVAHRSGGIEAALALARGRSGSQFDPSLVEVFVDGAEKVLGDIDDLDSWDAVIDAEPALAPPLSDADCDAALAAIATCVDLKSPSTLGHSTAVAELAALAGSSLSLPTSELQTLRRAAMVSRFGCLGVSNAIWDKRGPLKAAEWERVRLHPYLTGRMLRQSGGLAPLAQLAVQLRERMDGSGYPLGTTASGLTPSARVLAAADVYQSLREPRPHRPAFAPPDAATELRAEVKAGRLDGDAVEAVLSVSGHRAVRRREGPDGLTHREVEVLRLVARGASTKEVAAQLVISTKTAGTHIEHIYAKIDASTRAAAALYAVQRGLVPEERFEA